MPEAPLTVGPGCDQPRFVLPLPDRLGVEAPWGDVLLTLTRGLAHRKPEQLDTARTFRMSRIGDQALIRASDTSALKAAYSIQHLLAITYLPGDFNVTPTRTRTPGARLIPGTSWYVQQEDLGAVRPDTKRALDRKLRAAIENDSLPRGARTLAGLVKSTKLREGFGVDGGYYEFANEEYLHVEVDDDGLVVLWSASPKADAAADVIEELLGHPDPGLHGFVVSTVGQGTDNPSPRVLDAAKADPDGFHLVSVGYDDCIVTWRRPQVKMRAGRVRHIEMSYSAEIANMTLLGELMDRTATPHVRTALAKGGLDLIESLVNPGTRGPRPSR